LSLQQAVISIEDERFYEHGGIDLIGIVRSFITNVMHGGVREGASTITMQLARNLFLTPERTLSRKVREALLSLQIEKNYSKQQILEMYLNQIYFGEGAYGCESAARTYFGKHVEDLTVPECALLAALPKAPNTYDPYKNPYDALKRRNLVLNSMADNNYITLQEATEYKNTPIELKKIEMQNAPYFVEFVRQQLEARYGSNAVYKGGLSVYTTLDMNLQEAAQQAMENGLENAEALARKNRQSSIPVTESIQGALFAMDPHTGAIRAMIGGRNFRQSVFNRSYQALRQPGSAFKPIIYAAAIENGYTMADVILDSPVVYPDPTTGKPWRPTNFSNRFRGPTTLHTALMHSINVVTVKLLDKLGIQPVVNMARRLGITTPIKPNLSLGLGTSEVTLEEMVQAFSVFDNQGIRVEPFAVLSVKDSSGRVLENNTPVAQEVLDPDTAYIMTHTLQDVVDRGTGRLIRRMGFTYPAAGKTGTTNDNVDAWFIGYTPDMACGVWVGYDDRISLGRRQTGGETAAPIWADFMKAAVAGKPVKDFPMPTGSEDDFVTKKICTESGLLAGPYCLDTRDEVFKKETAPTKYCNIHTGPTATLSGTSETDNGSSPTASGSGDILEMEAGQQAPLPTPSPDASAAATATPGTAPDASATPTGGEAYPDEGF
ncbi:MAG TPA: PBP1A family penicillin-binding protein, partial [bacterium]|nr:PBP1A family penicillin-binding protein [bacterium]